MTEPVIEPIANGPSLWFSDDGDLRGFADPFQQNFLEGPADYSNRLSRYTDVSEPARIKRKHDSVAIARSGPSYRFKTEHQEDCVDQQYPYAAERAFPSFISSQEQDTDLQTLLSAPTEAADPDSWFEPRDITDERQEPLIQVLFEREPSLYQPTDRHELNNELDAFLQLLDNPAAFVGDDEEDFIAADAVATATLSPMPQTPSPSLPVVLALPSVAELAAQADDLTVSSLNDAQLVIAVQPESRSYLKSSANDLPRVEVELQHVPLNVSVGLVSVLASVSAVPIENEPQPLNDRRRVRFELRFGKSNSVQPCRVYFQVQLTLPSGESRVVQSPLSEPFIMRTNISQFMKAERLLVSLAAFGADTAFDTAWPVLGASISRHFFFTTGSTRTLTSRDVRFMHRLLGGGDRVPHTSFLSFWEAWYGPMARLFTDKNVRRLWTRRMVYGFVQRNDLRALLQSAGGTMRSGLFVLAFVENDSMPVIAWVHRDGTVRLTSLKRTDLREPFRLLLGRASHLSTMLRPVSHSSTSFELSPKEDVMQLLRPKKQSAREARVSPSVATPTANCYSPAEEVVPQYDDELN